ncbi:MAG TPA: hypothetical protein VFA82_03590 [Gaiellaceae bacterium]|nr:hypothetical protein [Gaiellaceae bacterium]
MIRRLALPVLLAAGCAPAGLVAVRGHAPPADGCARVVRASWMGGATFRDCSRRYSSSTRSAIDSTMRDGR